MAKVKGNPGSISPSSRRVSPLKPGLRGARNWASAQMRAASHNQKGFVRLVASIVAILIFVVFIGLWLGGFMPNVRQATGDFTRDRMMSMGFVIERVDVMGEGRCMRRMCVKPLESMLAIICSVLIWTARKKMLKAYHGSTARLSAVSGQTV